MSGPAGSVTARPGGVASQFETTTRPPRSALGAAVDVLSYLIAGPAAIAVVAGLVMTLADAGATNLTAYGDALTAAGVWALAVWLCLRALRVLSVARSRGVIGPLGVLIGWMVAIFFGIGALELFAAQLPLLLQGP